MEIELSLPTLHPKQFYIVENAKRYNVLKCGRRFGKTILTQELAIQPLLDGKYVGLWQPTYKDLHDVWIELKHTLQPIIQTKDESVKQLRLITGGVLDMWSLEDPNNGRGRKYHRIIVDECEKAKKFEEAWKLAIQPTLADYGGDAWFMSTPKFGMTYFKSLTRKSQTDDRWNSWVFSTYDNPHIPVKEIDELKNQMDELSFVCEIMAQDVDMVDKPFAYAFNYEKHVKECEFNPEYELYLSFDFNHDPVTCICAQLIDGQLRIFKEYKLANSNIYELCERIVTDFSDALLIVTGDATGNNTSAMVRDSINYYKIIIQLLNISRNQVKVPTVNPRIEQNRTLLNSVLQRGNIIISPECKGLIFDLKYVQVDDVGKIIKDRSTEAAKADLLDCFVGDTKVITLNGEKNISDIEIGEMILTRNGYQRCTDKWSSERPVYEITFSDGTKTTCTKEHKFLSNNLRWIEIFSIFKENLNVWKLSTTVLNTQSTQSKNTFIAVNQLPKDSIQDVYTDKCGLMFTEQYLKGISYTTKTETHLTTKSAISNSYREVNTHDTTQNSYIKTILNGLKNFTQKVLRKRKNGIKVKRVTNGTKATLKDLILENSITERLNAITALKNLKKGISEQDFAVITVNPHGEEKTNQILQLNNVFAEINLKQKNIIQTNTVQKFAERHTEVRVISIEEKGKQTVYDITVDNDHEFYANGILVHNCGRYLINLTHKDFIKQINDNTSDNM